jgi:hypothetical protein
MENIQVHTLLMAASILAAPRLASQLDSYDSPERDTATSEAVRDAEHQQPAFRTEDLASTRTQ